ncbi:amino acid adenylation domain-containing protein [Streptomyces sp. NPDC090106]|uniref:amino acid adenylation domain-containing protein n=1 Tax=Streptomyces sp. NPDC090106 TaxID=3365946 RepID=UPI0038239A21
MAHRSSPPSLAGFAGRPRSDTAPLSSQQRRLWFAGELGEGGAYHSPFVWRLRGTVDVAALASAVGDVLERHESLRTVFPSVDGVPRQRVLPPASVFSVAATTESRLAADVGGFVRVPFDLAADAPVRVRLFTVAPGESVLALSFHHIAVDRWSLGPLLRDLRHAYRARCEGAEPGWADVQVRYQDYARWQRACLGEESDPSSTAARELAFWEKTLRGLPDEVPLPVDRPRSGRAAARCGSVPVTVDAATHRRAVDLAREQRTSLLVVALAAWAGTLTGLGAGPDVPVGTPVTGRNDTALDEVVGFFVNTLVLRVDTSGDPTFRDLLGRAREVLLDAVDHQELPFERLVEALNPPRVLGRHPLFQTMVTLNDGVEGGLELHGLRDEALPVELEEAKFDLALHVRERGSPRAPSGMAGALQYSRELFDRSTALLLAESWQRFLTRAVGDPGLRLAEVGLPGRATPGRPDRPDGERAPGVEAGAGPSGPVSRSRGPAAAVPSRSPALPSPGPASDGVSGLDEDEQTLAALFATVLDVPSVGRDDDFFVLGGHSLLATRLISRVNRTFGTALAVRTLFEQATVGGLARAVRRASPEAAPRAASSGSGPRADDVPLSFAQQRLWFLDQLTPGRPTYNIPSAVRLRGGLDTEALCAALSALVARHEALRTVFPTTGGRPRQEVRAPRPVELPVTDLSASPDPLRAAHEAVTADGARPFGLRSGPLLRVSLYRLGPDDHVLGLVVHHIVFDAWSDSVLWRELGFLYAAFASGESPEPTPLPLQYADFAVRQRQRLESGPLTEQAAYWRARLADLPDSLDLPTDHERPALAGQHGATVAFEVPAPIADRLRDLGRAHDATLFMTLLAAMGVLLSHTAQSNIVPLATPIAGRTEPELEDLIGFFVNTLVLRADCTGDPTFTELLRRTRESALDAYAHQDLPYARLVEELSPQRDLGRVPLAPVMFQLLNTPVETVRLKGLRAERLDIASATTRFDLECHLVDRDGPLTGHLVYRTDLFAPERVEAMARRFQHLLSSVAMRPDTRLADLDLCLPDEHARIRHWNDTDAPLPRTTLPELLEQQVARTPDAAAVTFHDTTLTYAQLNLRANRLAHRLRALGAGPGELVALALPRSLDTVVALLAVLKSGAAYLPLDPDYPAARLAHMLADARPAVLLTTRSQRDTVRPGDLGTPALTVVVDDPALTDGASSADPDHAGLDPWELAYVLYTSGSTGTPKGVAGTHLGMVNRLLWFGRAFPIRTGDVMCAKSSMNFVDGSTEILCMLAHGGHVVLADAEQAGDVVRLTELLAERRVGRVMMVPSMLAALLDAGPPAERLAACTLWIADGEVLPPALAERFARTLPGARLVNFYGATEVSGDSVFQPVTGPHERAVPIGRPMDNTRVHVLDRRLRPLPPGAEGDLYLAGAGVARGYLGRPGFTADRFLPDPFGAPGARMYRTGDRARWSARGVLEFAGRADHQVKVRGVRVECGEVETALLAHPAVRGAVVVARGQGPAARLVAYVTAAPDAPPPGSGELRAHLRTLLPEHSVPSVFAVLDALPVNANGKLDRSALPEPDTAPLGPGTGRVAPRGSVQVTVARIWADALGRAEVDAHDDFFQLGGHSLMAPRVVAAMREALGGAEIPLRLLFEEPTVAGIAARIETARDHGPEAEAAPGPRRRHR